jgi:transposase-like protein
MEVYGSGSSWTPLRPSGLGLWQLRALRQSSSSAREGAEDAGRVWSFMLTMARRSERDEYFARRDARARANTAEELLRRARADADTAEHDSRRDKARAASEYLASLRWPLGFRCPMCDGDRSWRTSTQHWKCVRCGRKTSVTAGTIFHRTRTLLTTWFAAIWLVTSQKNGTSAQNIHDMLGLGSYETAWAWLHKLRRAMVRPDRELLSGLVEVDESFIGGPAAARQARLVRRPTRCRS